MSDEKPRVWHSVLAATLTVIVIGICLIGLYVLSLGMIGPAVIVGGGLFLLFGAHYIVWGWWLGPAIQRDVQAEEDEELRR